VSLERPSSHFVLSQSVQTGTVVVTTRAEEYRRLAKQCLEMARTISSPDGHDIMVQMARTWLRLAEEQETSIFPDRPAAQQQQQVQPKDDDKKE